MECTHLHKDYIGRAVCEDCYYQMINGRFSKMPELDETQENITVSRSHIKLIKNSRGVNWEIKLVKGDEDLEEIKERAVKMHEELETLFT